MSNITFYNIKGPCSFRFTARLSLGSCCPRRLALSTLLPRFLLVFVGCGDRHVTAQPAEWAELGVLHDAHEHVHCGHADVLHRHEIVNLHVLCQVRDRGIARELPECSVESSAGREVSAVEQLDHLPTGERVLSHLEDDFVELVDEALTGPVFPVSRLRHVVDALRRQL